MAAQAQHATGVRDRTHHRTTTNNHTHDYSSQTTSVRTVPPCQRASLPACPAAWLPPAAAPGRHVLTPRPLPLCAGPATTNQQTATTTPRTTATTRMCLSPASTRCRAKSAAPTTPAAAAAVAPVISATAQRQREAIEAFYAFKTRAENDPASVIGDRLVCRSHAREAGMLESTLRSETARLPPGLENSSVCLTLRRHVNVLLNIPQQKGVYHWRIAELQRMVLASFVIGPGKARHEEILGQRVVVIGKNTMNTHRNALKAWRRERRGKDGQYFESIRPPGRPTLLTPVEEQFAMETIDLSAQIAHGKDRRLGKDFVGELSKAVGLGGGGSKEHLQGVRRRVTLANGNKITEQSASNMSTLRAKALTPEKHATMFNRYKQLLSELRDAGRFEDSLVPGMPDADTHYNTDEVSPEYCGKYAKILCSGKLRKWRVKEGEHNPFHATGVVTVCGNGTFVGHASGVCHTSAAGGTNAHSLNLWARCFMWTTASGHMDEMGFLRLAELFIAAVGKEAWDASKPWNDQPAQRSASFESRPILWLLDGHYSHMYALALDKLADHDVHVFYTAAGSSEVDQVCDCGVMAHLQTAFGQALDDWRQRHPGFKWRPADWNEIFTAACATLRLKGGSAITSAWRKTGWYPLNPHAENYPPELYNTAVTVDPRGAARMQANAPQVEMLRPLEKEVPATVLRSRVTGAQKIVIAKAAHDFFLQSTVIPAAQAKAEAEAILSSSKEKPLVPEPDATASPTVIHERSVTACGAVGTREEFRANRRAGLNKRKALAQKKADSKRKREEEEVARRTKACHDGARLEALLLGGKELRELKVDELRTLILGRGGTVPTPTELGHSVKKEDLLVVAATLTPGPAAVEAVAAAVTAASSTVVDSLGPVAAAAVDSVVVDSAVAAAGQC